MARSARHRSGGGKQAARTRRERDGGKEKASEVMTAVRLVITVWELIWTIARDHWAGGGPGRIR
jgi:hypothetical protein